MEEVSESCVRVPVEMHVFHISSIAASISACRVRPVLQIFLRGGEISLKEPAQEQAQ